MTATFPPSLPAELIATREALHRLAFHVVTPARYRVTGRIGLRATPGGFGTPPFGDDAQVRVAGTDLIVRRAGTETVHPLGTLAEAAEAALEGPVATSWADELGIHDRLPPGDVDAPLAVDPAAAALIADWFALAFEVLDDLRGEDRSVDASEPQLWPEHFDAAIECGHDDHGRRASYGLSPGDDAHPEPYAYVSLWSPDRAPDHACWNATAFRGAVVGYRDLPSEGDLRGWLLDWFRTRRDVLVPG